jgi:hypothetical protein
MRIRTFRVKHQHLAKLLLRCFIVLNHFGALSIQKQPLGFFLQGFVNNLCGSFLFALLCFRF